MLIDPAEPMRQLVAEYISDPDQVEHISDDQRCMGIQVFEQAPDADELLMAHRLLESRAAIRGCRRARFFMAQHHPCA